MQTLQNSTAGAVSESFSIPRVRLEARFDHSSSFILFSAAASALAPDRTGPAFKVLGDGTSPETGLLRQ